MSETVHACCVAIDGRGVLIFGASGSGKSDLTLRLIDRGARLVSDDYTQLTRAGKRVIASAPAAIAGQIEVRGIGIVTLPPTGTVPIALVVSAGVPQRLPDPAKSDMAGVDVPMITLSLLEASAPLKVEIALRALPE
ncbi:MAG: HPr kinase/phosphatase C-terminal domain-containing protein [Pseudomonadota bacterium]